MTLTAPATDTVWHPARWLTAPPAGLMVRGAPRLAAGPAGLDAVAFDGAHDALVFPKNPLAGASVYTVEALLLVAPGGPAEQRLLHVQADASTDRLLLETRRADSAGRTWFADTIVATRGTECILAEAGRTHAAATWHTLALVCDGTMLHQFVDAAAEASASLAAAPFPPGRVCLGMRLNHITPFGGALAAIRFSRRALAPDALWHPTLRPPAP